MHRTRRAVLALTTLAAAGFVAGDLGTGGASAADACAPSTISAEDLGGRDQAFATDLVVTCDDHGTIRPCAADGPDENGDVRVTCERAD